MGKLIAVWGSPDSGKTTFSVKLAEALYNRSRGKSAVIVVFTDIVTPTIPVIFPNFRSEDVFSVGTILTKPDFFADDVVSNMVMTKDRMNLGYLGYKDSENKHSFPDYTEEKAKVKNSIYEEWCDTLIACQNDRTLKDTLMPVVSKLTDVRLVNNSLKTMLAETRREYWMMVLMVVGNVPLLYCLNRDWYDALMNTVFGKIVLAISGVVIIITAIRMNKITKPIEYKR